ncbi:MAG: AraC family transcriptional regulator, partial [bacterium]
MKTVTGCIILFFYLILIILSIPISSTIYFNSNFESGITVTQKALAPGAKTITLVENYRIEEWPIYDGAGVVQGNLPEKAEEFRYNYRKNNKLFGVKGICGNHVPGVEIRCGKLEDWDEISSGIKAARYSRLFGSFACHLPIKRDVDVIQIRKKIDNLTRYWVRFYVSLDSTLLSTIHDKKQFRIFYQLGQNKTDYLGSIRIMQREKRKIFIFHYCHYVNDEINLSETLYSDIEIKPDSLYCIAFHRDLSNSINKGFKWWINGMFQDSIHDTSKITFPRLRHIWFGIRDNKLEKCQFHGGVFLDEIMVSDFPLYPLPRKPEIKMDSSRLSLKFPDFGDISSSQWQISSENRWLLPYYESGELLNIFKIPPAGRYLKQKKNYECRARIKDTNGFWSDWSMPYSLDSNILDKITGNLTLSKACPLIKDAFLTDSFGKHKLDKIAKDRWYALSLSVDDPQGWQNLSFAAVWLSFAEMNLGNPINRGGKFSKKSNYIINFSLGDNSVFTIADEGSNYPVKINSRTMNFFNGRENRFDTLKKMVSIPFRLADEAWTGPWIINSFAQDKEGNQSLVFKRSFNAGEIKTRGKRIIYIPALGIILLLFACILTIRKYYGKEPEKVKKLYTPIISSGIDYIKNKYSNPSLSLAEVAENVNLSAPYFGKMFIKETGKVFAHYLNHIRIEA